MINEYAMAIDGETFTINFTSNNESFSKIVFEEPGRLNQYLYYDETEVADAHGTNGYTFYDAAYRTITLPSPATGDLLTWLQSNATLQ